MRVFIHSETDPGNNLALEEVMLASSGAGDDCCWLWTNEPSVILGRNQILEAEVNLPYARANNIPVFRRKTGGGAVYHDGGVLNFSFIIAVGSPIGEFLKTFLSVLDLATVQTERNDVLWQGRKIIGTAQRIQGGRRLFHGSLLYAADLERLARVLTPSGEKLRRHGVASVRSRVVNCGPIAGMSTDQFRLCLTERLANRFGGVSTFMPQDVLNAAKLRRGRALAYAVEGDGK